MDTWEIDNDGKSIVNDWLLANDCCCCCCCCCNELKLSLQRLRKYRYFLIPRVTLDVLLKEAIVEVEVEDEVEKEDFTLLLINVPFITRTDIRFLYKVLLST